MNRKILSLFLCFSLLLATTAHAAKGKSVTIILKSGDSVEGELIGVDESSITVKVNGKIKEYSAEKVKKAFDEDGHKLSFSGESSASEESKPAEEEESKPAKPAESYKARVKPKKNGAKIAGNVMMGVGLGGVLIGGLLGVLGAGQMSDATSTYYTGYYAPAGAIYTIDGEKGYYTYAQYEQYYTGLTERNVGFGILIVGGILGITGAIVSSTAGRNSTALLEKKDNEWALGLPQPMLQPDGGMRTTLLQAEF